ncbi:proton-conducting transporter membrane subunit [Haloglomus litoreum]|uniref:proton-conducting transporter transmembrane domain-containing protein n=1 Tax=Haloglomus litoreum TaxID=3034026 RepID=UPI0023E79A97|nr:proton-conducting transporter membrane subunit [Haloglomus sp. DT116]
MGAPLGTTAPAAPLTALPPALLVLAAAVVVAVVPRRAGTAVGALAAAAVVPWVLTVPAGDHLRTTLFGFDAVLFAVDGTARVVALALGLVTTAGVLYAHDSGTTRRELATLLGYVGAGLGAVFAGDWLSLVVWWELLAVGGTLLLWRSPSADGRAAGYRYAVYHQVGGALLVAGVLLHYTAAGSFLYEGGITAGLPRLLAVLGVGLNVGFIGLHVWLPDSYPRAGVAVSVVLCGVTTKVAVYALLRVVPGRSLALAWAGAAMLAVGVTLAVLQTETRRLLTYHIVSQVGYMVAGVGLASPLGTGGALAHLLNNVLYKSLLFMVAGVVLLRTGEERLKKLGGLGRAMPATAAAFTVAALAITGIPGFSGFVSKGMVIGAADAPGTRLLWWVLLVGGVGTVVSFTKFGYYAFVRSADHAAVEPDGTAAPGHLAAFAIVGVPCVVFGVAPELLLGLLPTGASSAKVFAVSQFEKAGATLLAGLVVFALVKRPLGRLPAAPDLDSLYHPAGARLRDGVARRTDEAAGWLLTRGERVVAALARVADGGRGPSSAARLGLPTDPFGRGVLLLAAVAAVAVAVAVL